MGQVAVLLQNISSRLDEHDCLSTADKALQVLTKMCAGNYPNQKTAFKGEVVGSIMHILRYASLSVHNDTEENKVSVTARLIIVHWLSGILCYITKTCFKHGILNTVITNVHIKYHCPLNCLCRGCQ